eukprot:138119-Amphidinium_carterae.1
MDQKSGAGKHVLCLEQTNRIVSSSVLVRSSTPHCHWSQNASIRARAIRVCAFQPFDARKKGLALDVSEEKLSRASILRNVASLEQCLVPYMHGAGTACPVSLPRQEKVRFKPPYPRQHLFHTTPPARKVGTYPTKILSYYNEVAKLWIQT